MPPVTSAAASPMVPARAGMTMAPLLAVPAPFGSVIRIRRLRHGFRNCYLAVTSLLLRRIAGQEAAQGAVQSQVGGDRVYCPGSGGPDR